MIHILHTYNKLILQTVLTQSVDQGLVEMIHVLLTTSFEQFHTILCDYSSYKMSSKGKIGKFNLLLGFGLMFHSKCFMSGA